ncbi:hypothetical protein DPMN_013200 [Dreissena polymorpha]|uniref:Uncharacterized protein n=1 Tax=Dreissena polymorpha TaxID=45954 RepID=A0A9D4N7H0_DREPO|nr:hypothetical protein DPMN_013200 [Dreissena polymorpha]
MENIRILDREPFLFERGVKEAIYIRALRPALNKDGGRYQLSHTWDSTLQYSRSPRQLAVLTLPNGRNHSADEVRRTQRKAPGIAFNTKCV